MINQQRAEGRPDVAAEVGGYLEEARAGQRAREIPAAIVDALTVLFTFFGQRLEPSIARVYARSLEGVFGAVLEATVQRAIDTRVFLPRPVELREDVDAVRTALREQRPYRPCARCEQTPGWVQTVAGGAVDIVNERGRLETIATPESPRAVRCPCYPAWLEGLQAMGLLPASRATSSPTIRGGVMTSTAGLAERFRQRLRVVGTNT